MKFNSCFLVLFALVISMAACQPVYMSTCDNMLINVPVMENAPVVDLAGRAADGRHIQKIDNLLILDDDAESMYDCIGRTEKRKISYDTVKRIQKTLPPLNLNLGLRSFGPYAELNGLQTETLYGIAANSSEKIKPVIITRTPEKSSLEPIARALDSVYMELKSVKGRSSLIILSDFGRDVSQSVYSAGLINDYYQGQVCIYPLVISYDHKAMQRASNLVKAAGCGAVGDAFALQDPDMMSDFVENILFDIAEPVADPVIKTNVIKEPIKKVASLEPERLSKDVNKQETEPKAVLPEPPVINELTYEKLKADKELKIYLNVHFDFDKSEIKDIDTVQLLGVAEFMKSYQHTNTVIEGHTCSIGTEKYNYDLSSRRAKAVKDYLVAKFGIDEARFKTVGYGSSRPIADNSTLKGRMANRRAEALIVTVIAAE